MFRYGGNVLCKVYLPLAGLWVRNGIAKSLRYSLFIAVLYFGPDVINIGLKVFIPLRDRGCRLRIESTKFFVGILWEEVICWDI